MIRALRLTASAPAFFVPAVMTASIVGVGLASIHESGWRRPWLDGGTDGLLLQLGMCLVVAAGIAGHIGLLEAARREDRPGPEHFLEGIRRFTVTIFSAKALIAAGMVLWLNRHDPWDVYYDYEPFYLALSGASPRAETWMILLLPSLLVAPVAGTVTLHRNPLTALVMAIATTIRHPIRVGLAFALQIGILVVGVALLDEALRWREDPDVVRLAMLAHGPTLSFHMFPFLAFFDREAGVVLALILVPLSSVFTTAYWSIGTGALHAAHPTTPQAPTA